MNLNAQFSGLFMQETPIVEPKKTLGQQIIDTLPKVIEEKQGTRETTLAMGDTYMKELQKCIQNHLHVEGSYYIQVFTKKETVGEFQNAIKCIFVARRSRPEPTWDTSLWMVNNYTGDCKLCWTLPHRSEADGIIKRWDISDPDLVKWCYQMISGDLK